MTEFIATRSKANLSSVALGRRFDFKLEERVLKYAEDNSGEKALRRFDIDPGRIRYREGKKKLTRIELIELQLSFTE